MFIDFEGIAGSGKTTLARRVALRLHQLGYRVRLVCEPAEAGSLAGRLRELAAGPNLQGLGARAELLLELAWQAQRLEESLVPSLARGEVCLAERCLYGSLALGLGRGLEGSELQPACALSSREVWPDLIILLDMDPDVAWARLEAARARQGRAAREEEQHALAGGGLGWRMRAALRAFATREPSRWLVLQGEGTRLEVLEQQAVAAVLQRLQGHRLEPQRQVPAAPAAPSTLEAVEEHALRALETLEAREPALALWLLSGVAGYAAHQRRLAALERLPGLAVRSLEGLEDEPSWDLREALEEVVPREVAASLGASDSAKALALRERLYARAPGEVLAGLERCSAPRAWALRERAVAEGRVAEVLAGLAGVEGEAAWSVREQGLQRGLLPQVARSLTGLDSPRAEALREALLPGQRLAVLHSTLGLDTPLAWGLREALEEAAPGLVLRTLTGLACEEAMALRERLAPRAPEALESLRGLDGPRAWGLREAHAGRWPAAALLSLEGRPLSARAEALLLRVLAAAPGRMVVLRNAWRLVASHAALPGRPLPAAGATATLG